MGVAGRNYFSEKEFNDSEHVLEILSHISDSLRQLMQLV